MITNMIYRTARRKLIALLLFCGCSTLFYAQGDFAINGNKTLGILEKFLLLPIRMFISLQCGE